MGLLLLFLGLTFLFDRLSRFLGCYLAGRLVGHANPLSLQEGYPRARRIRVVARRSCTVGTFD